MSIFQKDYSKLSDEELMSLLAQGGQSAFDELYARYSKPLLNFFYRMLNNNLERAEDMLHDLFLKIIEKPKSFDGNKRFNTWFYTLAGNLIKNEYRHQQVCNEHWQQSKHQPEQHEIITIDIDRQLFDKRLKNELLNFDIDSQMIFNLRFVDEMSIKQIAEIMQYAEGTIKSRLFYITKQLAGKLAIYKPN
jgi:RNA polymerase sigma-70 factor, ECF subfamily